MPTPNTRQTAAPLVTPCLACGRPTRLDGHCRTARCPNRFPDPAAARAEAVALARRLAQRPPVHTTDDRAPIAATTDQAEEIDR